MGSTVVFGFPSPEIQALGWEEYRYGTVTDKVRRKNWIQTPWMTIFLKKLSSFTKLITNMIESKSSNIPLIILEEILYGDLR